MKTWKMYKGKKREVGRTEADCTAVEQALKRYRQCSAKLKGKKSKTRVNGNCSEIIECMSKRLHLPVSNKYTACESKPVWAEGASAKSNQGEARSICKQGCSAVGYRNRRRGTTG